MKFLLGFLAGGVCLLAAAIVLNYVDVAPQVQVTLGGIGGFIVGVGLPVTALYFLVTGDIQ